MKFNPPANWFGAKSVGWGLRPATWEGWSIIAIFVAIVVILVTLL